MEDAWISLVKQVPATVAAIVIVKLFLDHHDGSSERLLELIDKIIDAMRGGKRE